MTPDVTGIATATRRLPPAPLLLLASMSCVQVGNALAIGVFDTVGPAGSAWLRLAVAALVLLAIVRPRVRGVAPAAWRAAGAFGVAIASVTVLFALAIDRLPLGTASALEFLGPLGVAIVTRPRGRAGLLLPLLAAAGVLALTRPWTGGVDALGVFFALLAAGSWAGYILLSRRVGELLPGLTGIALSFAVAAVVSTPVGLAQAAGGLGWALVAQVAGIALLIPLAPFVLEFVALRRMATAAFGILMCLEPAIGVLVGLVALGQVPGVLGVAGVALVVSAGVLAQRPPHHHRVRPVHPARGRQEAIGHNSGRSG